MRFRIEDERIQMDKNSKHYSINLDMRKFSFILLIFISSITFAKELLDSNDEANTKINEVLSNLIDQTIPYDYYEWRDNGILLGTSNQEHLALLSDSTYVYLRICPNLDHSTKHMSVGEWTINKKRLILNEFEVDFIRFFKGNMLIFSEVVHLNNCAWFLKKKSKILQPDGNAINICERSKLEKMNIDFPLDYLYN